MKSKIWPVLLLIGLSQAAPVAADIGRCANVQPLNGSDTATLDLARIPGTNRRPPATHSKTVEIKVVFGVPKGAKIGGLTRVRLVDAKGHGSQLPTDGLAGTHLGNIAPGVYTVEPSIAKLPGLPRLDLAAPPRRILLDQDVNVVYVHLGAKGRPYFRIGNGLVPFAPSRLTAVVQGAGAPISPGMRESIARTATNLHSRIIEPFGAGYSDSVVVLESDSATDQDRLTKTLREDWPSARVGMPIDVNKNSFRVLDNRYVVRFSKRPGNNDARRNRAMDLTGLKIIKKFSHDPHLLVVAFNKNSYRIHLALINCLVAERVLVTGEPDLVRSWALQSLPSDWPNDPRYPSQTDAATNGYHQNQRINEAWGLLYGDQQRVGDPGVVVGLVDQALDPTDDEVACSVDGGSPQLSLCWDPARFLTSNDGQCTSPLSMPGATHGMTMFGLIAACTNNGKGIAGIAPGVRISAVGFKFPSGYQYYASSDYHDLLLWIGGERDCGLGHTGSLDPCQWPQTKADVINNSYSIGHPDYWDEQKIDLPEVVATAFETLVTNGRNGKGTVLVFAGGSWENKNYATNNINPLAADARTIGVTNCWFFNAVEQLYNGELPFHPLKSNIGEKVDVCADGQNAETIPSVCPTLEADGSCRTGGSSAATATVTGIVALMLSANPDLSWTDVRDILRSTAKMVDPDQMDPDGKWVNGLSTWYGAGRVDAFEAVKAAMAKRAPP